MTDAARIYGLWHVGLERWFRASQDGAAVAAYLTHEDAEHGLAFWSVAMDGQLEIRVIGKHNTPQGEEQNNGNA